MKLTLFLAVFLAVFSIVFSEAEEAVLRGRGHCYHKKTGPMRKGEVKQIRNKCIKASCNARGTVRLLMCGTVNGKRVKPDYSKPYPECCNLPWLSEEDED
ncbi:unnamed protein product [Ceutorhynchus assimilis]|uniref:Single domain-containing protein n=1 Tax=Ceutorhynchus assimilis TaxID=467358 RepID=A0A9N9MFU3_9CUCU|nr:unnamed protein product [Ceutorhynchus assimilis]